MTDRTRKFLKNGITLSLAALLMRTVSVSFGAYVTDVIGAEGMGLYSLIMSLYTLGVTFATSGVQLATTRLVAEADARGDLGGARAALRTATRYALLFGSLASLVLFLGASFFGERLLGDVRTVPALRLLSLALVPVALSSVFSGYFTAVRRPSRSAAVSLLEQAVRIALTVFFLASLMPRGITYACLALVGGSAIAEIFSALSHGLLYFLDSRRLRRVKRGKPPLAALLHITLPTAAASYVRSGLVSAEHMLIPRALTGGGASREEALGAYGTLSGMSLPIALYPMAVLSAFAGLLVPEFAEGMARRDTVGNRRLAEKALTYTLWFSLAAGGVLAAFAAPLANAVYGYREAGYYLALLAPIIPIMYLDHVVDMMLKGLGRQVYAMGVNVVDSLGSILLVLLLLPRFGAVGYVYVILLAELFNFSMSLSGLYAVLPLRFPFLRGMLLPLAALLPSVTVCHRLFGCETLLSLIGAIVTSLLLYLLLLVALSFLFEQNVSKKQKKPPSSLDKRVIFGYNKERK